MKKLTFVFGLMLFGALASADGFSDVKITVHPAGGDVYMLQGAGGNMGVLATEDGLLLVDDQFEPLAKKIEQAMKGLVDKELKYIVNTHLHDDHTGSNSYFSHKAPIFAHENVRKRLSAGLADKASTNSHVSLPVVTYKDGVSIFLNN